MFSKVAAYAGDPILSLNEDFQRDPSTEKVNLTIGIYFDAVGRLPVLESVRQAEHALREAVGPRPYLPMAGLPAYREGVQRLVFGEHSAAVRDARVATIQSLGGGGALKVGADFLKSTFADAKVWVSDPTWDNHRVVFERAGFEVRSYPYYDARTGRLRFDAMLEEIRRIPRGDIVLLHACCHNPTGVDLTPAQWTELGTVLRAGGQIAFVDMAYQGFGDSLDDDAFAIRELARLDVPLLVANSFSKNFSLYGERCGGLSVVCADAEEANRVLGQLCNAVRGNYSNPPTYGAAVVSRVLESPVLFAQWRSELEQMKARIAAMRHAIHDRLSHRMPSQPFSHYLEQRGMFTYTGLSPEQVDALRERHGVYLLRSGRMCVAGLNDLNVAVVADAIAAVMDRWARLAQ
jgi:aromatic-amino-acid transaminase